MSVSDLINSSFIKWMDTKGPNTDIVLSSRIRLARNLTPMPFPQLLDETKGKQSMQLIKDAFAQAEDKEVRDMEIAAFNQLSALDREILVEKHLTSPNHVASGSAFRGLAVNRDGSLAVMINEEDHLRIQCLLPGLQLEQSYAMAGRVDDGLEKHLDYAFDERRGYLTSCPTNVGTGMRASVMLHLPAMAMAGQINQVFQNISQLGMTVRGLYGEGTEIVGSLYQLSNQVTMGLTEEDIINNLSIITGQIIQQERLLRQKMHQEMQYQLEDKIGRSYGILTNARVISSNEALTLLSDVRLGVDMGIIKNITALTLNELEVAIRPAHLQRQSGQEMDPAQRDVKRAQIINDKFNRKQE